MFHKRFAKVHVKAVINNVVNIALVIIYFRFFGQLSLKRYFDKAVIITTQEETPSSIIPPSKIYLCQILLGCLFLMYF